MKFLFFYLLLAIGYWLVPPVFAATLSLSPQTLEVNETNQGILTLTLDPQGYQVIGTDVFLTYNPERLKVISVQNRTTIPGNPATIIDNDRGVAKFSLINPYGSYTTLPGPLADITITPLTDQTTTLTLKHTQGNTADSNVAINGGLDALTTVTHATIIVTGTGNPNPTTTPTPTPKHITVLPDLNPTPPGFAQAVKTTKNNQLISPIPESLLAPTSTPSATPTAMPGRILGYTDNLITPSNATDYSWYPLILGLASLLAGFFTYFYFKRRQTNPYCYSLNY